MIDWGMRIKYRGNQTDTLVYEFIPIPVIFGSLNSRCLLQFLYIMPSFCYICVPI